MATDNYLEMAAEELRIAKNLLSTPARLFQSTRDEYKYRMRLAAAYTKLAAIQAGLPPGECQAITTGGAE